MKRILLTFAFLLLSTCAYAEIQTQEIDYSADGITFKGYLAYDDAIEGTRPGVIVVHEWWGHNDYARKRTEMLAELGYTALAVDMYGDGKVADHPDDAGAFASAVMSNMDGAKKRFEAGLAVLKGHPMVDSKNVAAIGYCFGGGTVLNMARMGVDLNGVVSFHGSLASSVEADKSKVKARVLVCHGQDDNFITPEQITAFKQEMDGASVDYKFIEYEGAVHSFTNPEADKFAEKFGLGLGYNAEADQKSWQDMQQFFEEIFAK